MSGGRVGGGRGERERGGGRGRGAGGGALRTTDGALLSPGRFVDVLKLLHIVSAFM